jgi:uncharacterized protein (DUF2267 family)
MPNDDTLDDEQAVADVLNVAAHHVHVGEIKAAQDVLDDVQAALDDLAEK